VLLGASVVEGGASVVEGEALVALAQAYSGMSRHAEAVRELQ